MAAKFEQTKIFSLPMQDFLAELRSSRFTSTLNFKFKSENQSSTGIWYRFHHGVSLTSWGEKITITLTPVANTTQITVLSECGLPTQIIDLGKNRAVVCNIFEHLEKYVKPGSVPASEETIVVSDSSSPQSNADKTCYCSKCGKQLFKTDKFCTACGNKIEL